MSHFTKVKTKASNKEGIKKALKRLFPDQEILENASVSGWMKNTVKADVVLKAPKGQKYDVGYQQQKDGTYSAVSDFSMSSWAGRNSNFQQDFDQIYAVETAKLQAEEMGAFCTEQVQEDGSIQLHIEEFN